MHDVSEPMSIRQTTFLNGEDLAPAPKITHPARKSARLTNDEESLRVLLREALAPLIQQVAEIQKQLAALVQQAETKPACKDYYTTDEAAKLLGKRPYTVREWCRLGRIHAEKANFGRGQDEEWRISHGELTRIQNEGLLSPKRDVGIAVPRRLPK